MIKVQKLDFNINVEIKKITSNNRNIGGIGLFIGVVRDGDQKLKSITLEHYPIMTEKMLEKINIEAKNRWKLIDSIIIHRHGKLYPGDQIRAGQGGWGGGARIGGRVDRAQPAAPPGGDHRPRAVPRG